MVKSQVSYARRKAHMSGMFIVVINYSFDPEVDVEVFKKYEDAAEYLQKAWEDYYNAELALGSILVEDECYHEDDFAQLKWKRGGMAWFHLIEMNI